MKRRTLERLGCVEAQDIGRNSNDRPVFVVQAFDVYEVSPGRNGDDVWQVRCHPHLWSGKVPQRVEEEVVPDEPDPVHEELNTHVSAPPLGLQAPELTDRARNTMMNESRLTGSSPPASKPREMSSKIITSSVQQDCSRLPAQAHRQTSGFCGGVDWRAERGCVGYMLWLTNVCRGTSEASQKLRLGILACGQSNSETFGVCKLLVVALFPQFSQRVGQSDQCIRVHWRCPMLASSGHNHACRAPDLVDSYSRSLIFFPFEISHFLEMGLSFSLLSRWVMQYQAYPVLTALIYARR